MEEGKVEEEQQGKEKVERGGRKGRSWRRKERKVEQGREDNEKVRSGGRSRRKEEGD